MSNYWAERVAKAQLALSNKSLKKIEKQLAFYYGATAKRVIADFEATYNKVLLQQVEGKQVTPADLYKLDAYWQMQGQLRQELRKLGEKQISLLTKEFETNFFEIYYSLNIEGATAFSTIDTAGAMQLINSIWVADGKTFSQRIWENTEKLVETLNEQLIHCVTTGKKTTELKKILQERFGVSYNNADMIARTELAHVQTEAAKQRYKDYGVEQVEIWADPDERTCEICGKLHQKKYPTGAHVPIPAHPRCRCCIVPVID